MGKYLVSSAEISACGRYRHSLLRVWDDVSYACLFVLLNPSTADGSVDDPTVRKCVGFAKEFGCGAMEIVNLFDYRATRPLELFKVWERSPWTDVYPVSPDWRRHFEYAVQRSEMTVVGWGAHGKLADRDRDVMNLLKDFGVEPQCLAVNKDRTPKHPLYVGYGTELKSYSGRPEL